MLKMRVILVLATLTVLNTFELSAQGRVSQLRLGNGAIDSLAQQTVDSSQKFYDTLASRSKQHGFYRMLHSMFIHSVDLSRPVDEAVAFRPYAGYRIGQIEIECRNVFDNPGTIVRKAANATHTVTQSWVVRGNLLFAPGESLDPDLLVRNLQYLRSLNYIYEARIIVIPNREQEHTVDILIVTRDNWSFDVDGSVGRSEGQLQLSGTVINNNALGMGSRLKLTQAVYGDRKWYAGTLFEMTVPNLFGSFVQLDLQCGRRFNSTRYLAQLSHELILPTDYLAGARLYINRYPYRILQTDSVISLSSREIDLWGGGAVQIPNTRSSLYAGARYYKLDFFDRLHVSPTENPYMYNRHDIIGSVALYREKFYAGTLIYGYGFKESIATGYKLELTGGLTRHEYGKLLYGGATFAAGRLTQLGHVSVKAAIGSYFDPDDGRSERGVLSATFNYFTNLLGKSNNRVRQFCTIDYTRGFCRLNGAGETLTFTRQNGPRGYDDFMYGTNRLIFNNQTVLFTPWEPAGFRIAMFGFIDVGLIGNNSNVFSNDLFSTIGIGVRLRNERLVFNAIQLRLGIAFGKNGLMKNNWIVLDTWQRTQTERYTPVKPQYIEYK